MMYSNNYKFVKNNTLTCLSPLCQADRKTCDSFNMQCFQVINFGCLAGLCSKSEGFLLRLALTCRWQSVIHSIIYIRVNVLLSLFSPLCITDYYNPERLWRTQPSPGCTFYWIIKHDNGTQYYFMILNGHVSTGDISKQKIRGFAW